MVFATANGLQTHVQMMSAGRPGAPRPVGAPLLVCVHGLGYDSLASFYLTLAAPLSLNGVDVITYDLRGHGRSERPATGYRLGDFVADLAGLLDELGVARPVHLVGNSFGGTIAFSFAAAFPERVASIVSIEAEPATEVWSDKIGRTMANVIALMAEPEYVSWVGETFGAHYARLTKIAVTVIRGTSIIEDVALGPLLDAGALAAIRCPVLSILGGEGFQSDDLTAVESVLPNCRTEVIDGQNHSVLVEAHRKVRTLVLDWLGEHEPGWSGWPGPNSQGTAEEP